MVPNTCEACGYFYGEHNRFVQQSHCCPQCGQKVHAQKTQWQLYKRMTIAVLAGVLVVLSFLITSSLLLT
jgi:uncharacterized paraquat-inducible protein A